MIEDKKLLELETKLENLKKLAQIKEERLEELKNNPIIKEYLLLMEEHEELNSKIADAKFNYLNMKTPHKNCKHETFIYQGTSTIEHYSDIFISFDFKCSLCGYEENFITGLWNNKIFSFDERELFNFIKTHNIETSYGNTKEEIEKFLKEYIDYATFDGLNKANEYALTRKRKFE